MKKITLILFALLMCFTLYADEKKPLVTSLDHLGLSVKHLEKSADFFVEYLGFNIRGEDSKYPAKFLSNGFITLTLWQTTKDKSIDFNRKTNVGLHHLALSVPSFEALDELYKKIKGVEGVVIEFAPESFYGGPSKHMMIREPSGNRIEFLYRTQTK